MTSTHVAIDPAILYFGTPVALISTQDEDGVQNLAPISSIFWLGHRAVLGVAARSQTGLNLTGTRECVINLPDASLVDAVDRLALTTGRHPVSERKSGVGYRHVRDKFAHAGLTPLPSDTVAPARVAECPVTMEGPVMRLHELESDDPARAGGIVLAEVAVTRVHVHQELRMAGHPNRVDPLRWHPLLMSFQRFFGMGGEVSPSRLASIDEEWYRPGAPARVLVQ
ncbi:flavin reductase family protein [Leifsonia poae]|uniref:Flavin reductase n=1 Tax=Leifsonia poae TaxID=110933 RepID=A0A9W6HC06_9MICO|nr:flavin reductase family protein [Leifsonia poae]GLJ77127.1 flavin reductase [Leifsonia poae]